MTMARRGLKVKVMAIGPANAVCPTSIEGSFLVSFADYVKTKFFGVSLKTTPSNFRFFHLLFNV